MFSTSSTLEVLTVMELRKLVFSMSSELTCVRARINGRKDILQCASNFSFLFAMFKFKKNHEKRARIGFNGV